MMCEPPQRVAAWRIEGENEHCLGIRCVGSFDRNPRQLPCRWRRACSRQVGWSFVVNHRRRGVHVWVNPGSQMPFFYTSIA